MYRRDIIISSFPYSRDINCNGQESERKRNTDPLSSISLICLSFALRDSLRNYLGLMGPACVRVLYIALDCVSVCVSSLIALYCRGRDKQGSVTHFQAWGDFFL